MIIHRDAEDTDICRHWCVVVRLNYPRPPGDVTYCSGKLAIVCKNMSQLSIRRIITHIRKGTYFQNGDRNMRKISEPGLMTA
jgi:hypothetical protein